MYPIAYPPHTKLKLDGSGRVGYSQMELCELITLPSGGFSKIYQVKSTHHKETPTSTITLKNTSDVFIFITSFYIQILT
jgi:hypothetical protein